MKTKLYDFSAPTALIVCASYALLMYLFGYIWATDGHGLLYGIVFILLLISFLAVFTYYVILAPKISGKTLSHGSKQIRLKNVRYKAAYDERLKEKVVVFWDKKTEIKYLSNAEYKKKTIRVQATDKNLRKIGEWLGCTVPMPEKPPRKRLFRRK